MIDAGRSPTEDAEALDHARALPLLVVAAAQGLALYGLHQAIDFATWPASDARALLVLYSFALFIPLALLLSPREWSDTSWRFGIAATALIVFGCGWYIGTVSDFTVARPDEVLRLEVGFFVFWFIALPFSQAAARARTLWAASGPQKGWRQNLDRLFDYPTLFELGWQNCLRIGEATVFTGLLWALLFLGAGLFKLINIGFVLDLIRKPMFAYPVSVICFAFALYLLHTRDNIVRTLRRHLLAIFQWLLPLAVGLAATFLVTLLFTGMEPLWSTRHSASLVGALLIFLIVLYNAAYADGVDAPAYPRWLANALRWGVLTLPPLAAIGLYALALRISQHGLSVDRIVAVTAHAVLALYAFGYAFAVRHGRWLATIGRTNIVVALVQLMLMALLASPVLDPARLTAGNQLARLNEGKISAGQFDYDYFRFHLGKHGLEALRGLAADGSRPQKIRSLAQTALARPDEWRSAGAGIQLAENLLTIYPAGKKLDPDFLAYANDPAGLKKDLSIPECLRVVRVCTLLLVDLDSDGRDEVIFFQKSGAPAYSRSLEVSSGEGADRAARPYGWRRVGVLNAPPDVNIDRFLESAKDGPITAHPSRWSNLTVGTIVLRFSSN